MSALRWIWAYLFDCVHSHTTWPHQDQFGHACVCCTDCSREMPYSVEYMHIVRQDRKRNILDSRFPATASLIIAGALLLLTPSYALAETARPSADQNQTACVYDNITPTLMIGFVGGFVHRTTSARLPSSCSRPKRPRLTACFSRPALSSSNWPAPSCGPFAVPEGPPRPVLRSFAPCPQRACP